MREIRQSGSEGGARAIPCSYPYFVASNPKQRLSSRGDIATIRISSRGVSIIDSFFQSPPARGYGGA